MEETGEGRRSETGTEAGKRGDDRENREAVGDREGTDGRDAERKNAGRDRGHPAL